MFFFFSCSVLFTKKAIHYSLVWPTQLWKQSTYKLLFPLGQADVLRFISFNYWMVKININLTDLQSVTVTNQKKTNNKNNVYFFLIPLYYISITTWIRLIVQSYRVQQQPCSIIEDVAPVTGCITSPWITVPETGNSSGMNHSSKFGQGKTEIPDDTMSCISYNPVLRLSLDSKCRARCPNFDILNGPTSGLQTQQSRHVSPTKLTIVNWMERAWQNMTSCVVRR